MRIAVSSGKGGTGKTTVATALATIAFLDDLSVAYIDCDVEEPNGHILLKPEISSRREAHRIVPSIDESQCDYCGKCSDFCAFNAIACGGEMIMLFPEMCHGCGGCRMVCPSVCISETRRQIGSIEIGSAGGVLFAAGRLNVGEAMSPPLINQVKHAVDGVDLTIVDSPPGTSCPVIESVKGCDYVILVTEPTPFGLSDLKLSVAMVKELGLRCGAVINRSGSGYMETEKYLAKAGIDVLARIPDDRSVAEAYSRGIMIIDVSDGFRKIIMDLLKAVVSIEDANESMKSEGVRTL